MTINSTEDFFDTYAGGGQGAGAPSFYFDKVGAIVKGTVVSTKVTDQTYFGTTTPIPDDKRPGQNKKQIVVVLETGLRNWDGIKNTPTLEDGVTVRPASEDTGARAIYVKGWMIGAVADAIQEATDGKRKAPIPGDQLAVKLSEKVNTGKGNPLNKFTANAKAAPEGAELFDQAEEDAAQAKSKVDDSKPSLDDGGDDEPPF